MAQKIKLDHDGIGAMLQSEKVASAIVQLGDKVAAVAGGQTVTGATRGGSAALPVLVEPYTASGPKLSPRPGVQVMLAHPAGLRVEAKYGVLTKSAAAVGLEVKPRKRAKA